MAAVATSDAEQLAAFKRRQQRSNRNFDFLKRLGDQCPVGQRYVDGRLNVHLHVAIGGEEILAGIEVFARIKGREVASPEGLPAGRVYYDQIPVFVLVGQGGESLRPVDSYARLYRLDQVALSRPDPCQIGRNVFAIGEAPGLSGLEAFALALDGELRLSLSPGNDMDRVVQRGPEVVHGLTDPDAEIIPGALRCREFNEVVSRFRLAVGGHHHLSFAAEGLGQTLDVRHMFLCPTMPPMGAA